MTTVVMNHPQHGKFPWQLSDVRSNAVAMVADIAFRCVETQPHLPRYEAALKTQSCALIDEVDMFPAPSTAAANYPVFAQRISTNPVYCLP